MSPSAHNGFFLQFQRLPRQLSRWPFKFELTFAKIDDLGSYIMVESGQNLNVAPLNNLVREIVLESQREIFGSYYKPRQRHTWVDAENTCCYLFGGPLGRNTAGLCHELD